MSSSSSSSSSSSTMTMKKRPRRSNNDNNDNKQRHQEEEVDKANDEYCQLILSSSSSSSLSSSFVSKKRPLSSSVGLTTTFERTVKDEDVFVTPEPTDSEYDGEEEEEEESSSSSKTTALILEASVNHFHRTQARHRERPERIWSIQRALQKTCLWDDCHVIVEERGQSQLHPQLENLLARTHLSGYLKRLKPLEQCPCQNSNNNNNNNHNNNALLDQEQAQYDDVFLTKDSIVSAKQAASCLCYLLDHVVNNKNNNNDHVRTGFAMIRPPGHHAGPGMAGGYCWINNVAVGANHLHNILGMQQQRVLILDWDVHHGNGTQQIFWNDPNTMYISIHRHAHDFFPFSSQESGPTMVGGPRALGKNVNVAWTSCCKSSLPGDDEYYATWQHLVLPMINEWQPNAILISAGFDAADGDAGQCHVTPECFGILTQLLLQTCHQYTNNNNKSQTKPIPIVATLEGGYVPRILGDCVTHVIRAMTTFTCHSSTPKKHLHMDMPLEDMEPTARRNLLATMEAHRPYWKCLQKSSNKNEGRNPS